MIEAYHAVYPWRINSRNDEQVLEGFRSGEEYSRYADVWTDDFDTACEYLISEGIGPHPGDLFLVNNKELFVVDVCGRYRQLDPIESL